MRPKGEKLEGKLFTFRSAGWVLVLALVVSVVVILQTAKLVNQHRSVAFGDGKNVETYKFSLTPSLIPADAIVASGMPREGVRPMVDPAALTAAEMAASPDRKIKKLLVPSDRVIGVVIGGEARAYPLRMMNWHEVANDTLGGVPIAVTYHPLTDATAVFDRRMDGETRIFAVSGLLWNSGQLIYARQLEPGGESLWSQLLARAVTGPAAAEGKRLDLLHSTVVSWGDWLARHPKTEVIAPDRALKRQYPRMPYANYFGTQAFRFPVSPYPPPGDVPAWSRVLVLTRDGTDEVIHHYEGDPKVAAAAPAAGVRQAFRWAWYSATATVPPGE